MVHSFESETPSLVDMEVSGDIEKQKQAYDFFLYLEDDIGIPWGAVLYWAGTCRFA